MTKEQKQQIINIIENDCLSHCLYISYTGKTCAIGALAQAAGWDFRDETTYKNAQPILSPSNRPLAQHVSDAYELTFDQLECIQRLNDAYYTVEERRIAIIKYINTILP